jgi:hypothetical protein
MVRFSSQIFISMYEIYNDTIRDLFNPANGKSIW